MATGARMALRVWLAVMHDISILVEFHALNHYHNMKDI